MRERESKIKFKRIGDKEDLMVFDIGDTSFKSDEKAVGVLLFLTNLRTTRVNAHIISK